VRIAAPAVVAAVCMAFCGRTFARNFDWLDEYSLWNSAALASPASYRSHEHLAKELAAPSRKAFDAADREAARAVAILEPLPEEQRVAVAYSSAGYCYRVTGESLGANGGDAWYRKALDVLLQGKAADEAWDREFARQNRLVGDTVGPVHYLSLYLELGRSYRDLGQYQNALDALAADRWSDPKAEIFEEISKTYRAMGNAPQATVALLQGITMGVTEQVRLAAEVVNLYRETAPESCALAGRGESAAINFDCPLVRNQLCLAGRNAAITYHQMHMDREAGATAASAIRSLDCPADMFR